MSEQKRKRAGKRSVVCKCQALWKSSVSEWHGLRPPALYSPGPSSMPVTTITTHTRNTHTLKHTHTVKWGCPCHPAVSQPHHSRGAREKIVTLHVWDASLAHVSTGPCLFYPGFPYLMTPTHLTPLPLIMSQYIFKCYTMTFGYSPSYRLRPFQNGTFVTVAQQRPKCTENIQKSHWYNKHTETVTKSTWNNILLKAAGLISGVWFQNKNVYHVCMVPPKVPRELFHSYACLQQCMQFQARHRYGGLLIHIFSTQRL